MALAYDRFRSMSESDGVCNAFSGRITLPLILMTAAAKCAIRRDTPYGMRYPKMGSSLRPLTLFLATTVGESSRWRACISKKNS